MRKRESKADQKLLVLSGKTRTQRKTSHQDIDERYFEGYGDIKIHREMLDDQQRMDKYQHAIQQVCKHKTVIDVGSGTGVLSIMAAQTGATLVTGIEQSEVYKDAIAIVEANGLQNKVIIVQGLAEDFCLIENKVDVIISEWMGYMLLFENMLPSVLKVRDACLKEGGLIIPRKAFLYLALFRQPQPISQMDLSALNSRHRMEAVVQVCPQDWIISNSQQILEIDLKTDNFMDNSFTSDFSLDTNASGDPSGIVIWSDCLLSADVTLSTSPAAPPTHWKQTLLYFKDPVSLPANDQVSGTITVKGLQISMKIDPSSSQAGFFQKYHLD